MTTTTTKCEELTAYNNFERLEKCERDAEIVMKVGKGKSFRYCVVHAKSAIEYAHENGWPILSHSI